MDQWRSGEWRAICDVCGFEFYASELVSGVSTNQRGLKVCKQDLDKQNPQEFVRSREESLGVPWARPGDNEGVIGETIGSVFLDASLIDVLYIIKVETTSFVFLPTANNSAYKGISVTLSITNSPDSGGSILLASTPSVQGLTNSVAVGTTAKVRNIPSQNIWLREA